MAFKVVEVDWDLDCIDMTGCVVVVGDMAGCDVLVVDRVLDVLGTVDCMTIGVDVVGWASISVLYGADVVYDDIVDEFGSKLVELEWADDVVMEPATAGYVLIVVAPTFNAMSKELVA